MFLLDELYKGNSEYLNKRDYIEKFLFYRKQQDDIDVDVCEINIDNYKKNQLIGQEAEKKLQQKYNKSQKKYELLDGKQTYRGDTIINCMQILLQIVKYDNMDSLITVNNIDEICNGIKKSSVLVNNSEMRSLLNKFVEKCYCEGNFFAIPFKSGFSLNRAKAKLKLQGYQYTFVDSSDTYFKVCYDYFVNGQNVCQLTKLIDLKYEMWKERYRDNWGLFISDNCFQDFMDLDGKPLRLWNKTEDGFSRDLKNYLRKAIDVLSKREERLSINNCNKITGN